MIHAELAKSALEASDIAVAINDGVRVGGSGMIDLLVREKDVEAALEILGPEERFSD